LSTEPAVCMKILILTLSWSFGLRLDWNWKVLIYGNFAKRTFICVSGLCRISWNIFNNSKTLCM